MNMLLPPDQGVKISHSAGKPTRSEIDRLDHVVVLVPKGMRASDWSRLPYHEFLKERLRHKINGVASGGLPTSAATAFSIGVVDKNISAFERLTLARKLLAPASQCASVGVLAPGFAKGQQAVALEALTSAALADAAEMPSYKSKPPRRRRIRKLRLLAATELPDLDRCRAEADGNQLARWLSVLPANRLYTKTYRQALTKLAKREGWQYRFVDEAALKKAGAGAFLAVCQGSPDRHAGIAHLKYRPAGANKSKRKTLALVGKGICFDTGGTNLKPHDSMLDMHEDMGGSATALGAFLALSRMGVDRPIDCWLALSENMIGDNAYKPQDVVSASNGVTIQVIHTDAEGRMVLADTLALASRSKPALIIDFATLTGACVRALTTRMSGIFSNRDDWNTVLTEIGRKSGERVWPFSIGDTDYDDSLESPIADIKQCSTEGAGDHIYAGRFLRRFVPDSTPWIHIDLSAASHKGGLAHVPTQITGFGVRYTIDLLEAGLIGDK